MTDLVSDQLLTILLNLSTSQPDVVADHVASLGYVVGRVRTLHVLGWQDKEAAWAESIEETLFKTFSILLR